MVAFRRGTALVTAGYLLGIIFVAFPTLHPILFSGNPTNADYDRVERYFGAWWEAPPSVKLLLHADIFINIVAISSKFATYTEQAWYFDGGSLVLMIIGLSLYISSLQPGIKMLNPHSLPKAGPLARFIWKEAKYEAASIIAPGSETAKIKPLNANERKETIAVACASIVLIAVVLVGVMILQVGEWYAVREQRRVTLEALRADKKRE